MARAIELARRAEGRTHPNPMVGCVLVRDGAVVGEGWHEVPGGAHAEVAALRAAGERARGATAYVTLEPCNHHGRTPPCSEALIGAGVAEVVYGRRDPNPIAVGGADALAAAGIAARAVEGDARRGCEDLVRPWVHSLRRDRPWVTAKLAATLDGYTATAAGEAKWITSDAARGRGHDLRQRCDAILVGSGTALADDPGLDARPGGRRGAPSLKIVLDTHLRTPPTARLLATPGPALVVGATGADPARAAALEAAGAEVLLLSPDGEGRADLAELLRRLRARGVVDLMIEGGPRALGAAFDARVVDEVWAFVAPILLGGGQAAIASRAPRGLLDALRLTDIETERLGPDVLVRGRCERNGSEDACSPD